MQDPKLVAPAKYSIIVTNLKNKRVKTWYIGGSFSEINKEAIKEVADLIAYSIIRMQSASNNGNKTHRKRVAKS